MNIREPVNPTFPEVYLIGINDYVLGGETGIANRQAKKLVERDAYLKQEFEKETAGQKEKNIVFDNRISRNEENITANTAAINHLNDIVVVADNEGVRGMVTGERELEDHSTDSMITVLPDGRMKMIGFERLMPRIVGENREVGRELSPWELAKYRLLEPNFQLIEIAKYNELCNLKYCGDANNNTARWWYKCDHLGNRTITGLWMRVEDRRGLFARCAGANAAVRPSNDTLYDGGVAGSFIGDAIASHHHNFRNHIGANLGNFHQVAVRTLAGNGGVDGAQLNIAGGNPNASGSATFTVSTPTGTSTAHETRSASLMANYYIAY